MANKFGVNYTIQDPVGAGDTTGLVPAVVDVAEWGGRVRVCYDSFTADGATGASDVIYLGKVPANATLLYGVFEHDNSNSNSTYAITVGATTMKSAAAITLNVPLLFGIVTAVTKIAALSDVKVTLGTAALADTKTVKCMIYYTID